MTPLRAEEITLFCEDREGGLSQRVVEAAVQSLHADLPFAQQVRPIGVLNKNDVQVRTKFARTQPRLRVFGVRDRDFIPRALFADLRSRAFHKTPDQVTPWPLRRHCIESYLLEDDVIAAAAPTLTRAQIDEAAAARLWLDLARGTLEDLAFRTRKLLRHDALDPRPVDRDAALRMVVDAAARIHERIANAGAEEGLGSFLDELAADITGDGPLWARVDGRELVYDLERLLQQPRGSMLTTLGRHARLHPPAALIADVREALEAMPHAWRNG